MKAVLYILMATAMTYATAASAGYLLARAFRLKLERFVEWVAGSAILSGLVFLLAAAGLARRGVFVALSALLVSSALAAGLRERHRAAGGVSRQGLRRLSLGLPPAWAAAFWVVYLAFGWLYLSQALSPETSADALAYHTGLVARYAAEHRIFPIRTTFYASFPGAVEMLFLFAFSIGRYSAASMVEFLFLALAPFGILSWARRAGHPVAGVVGALLFYASPVVGRDGTVAYVDVAAAGIAFALFCALQQWRNERTLRLAAFAGLLAGFGAATKYTQCVGLLYGLGMLAFCLGRRPKALARTAAAFCAAALVMAGPWLVKNALFVANPVSPFFNRLFPNPYVYPSFETDYSQALRNLNGVTPAQYPLEAAVYGGRLDGFAGPVFLLAPLALLALRRSAGRQTLAAAAVYLAPCVAAISVRLMIPALLFIALALALAVERKTAVAALLLAVHAVTCWPAVAGRYAHGAWRIEAANWPAALRRVPEEDYLRSRLPDYDIWTAVRAYVPPGARVLASIDNRAYQPRELIVPYESALGNRLGDAVNRKCGFFETARNSRAGRNGGCWPARTRGTCNSLSITALLRYGAPASIMRTAHSCRSIWGGKRQWTPLQPICPPISGGAGCGWRSRALPAGGRGLARPKPPGMRPIWAGTGERWRRNSWRTGLAG
ncbi:MAG: hypothetical protein LAQ30_28285 [Acidobacteriia bacterium]|nr:hypothetical protein [Terriglobia bacterium]